MLALTERHNFGYRGIAPCMEGDKMFEIPDFPLRYEENYRKGVQLIDDAFNALEAHAYELDKIARQQQREIDRLNAMLEDDEDDDEND